MLKKSNKPIVLVCNKADNFGQDPDDIYEFYNLGLGEPSAISAANATTIESANIPMDTAAELYDAITVEKLA